MEELKSRLQAAVGELPRIEIKEFRNWSGIQRREKVFTATPESLEEVQSLIRAARKEGLQVRAAGKAHSWTPLFADEGNLVLFTTKIKRPGEQIEMCDDPENPEGKLVTLAASITLDEFAEFQLANNVCVPSNPIVGLLTHGGVLSTASHGSGIDEQTTSDRIASMRIIDSNGDVRSYSRDDDEHMLRAVQCSLGLWGIILDVTLKVTPMIIVDTVNIWKKVKDVFYNQTFLKDLIFNNSSVQLYWIPFSGISKWEAFEAFLEHEIDCGEWDPKEDDVWIRLVNKSNKTQADDNTKLYEFVNFHVWLNSKMGNLADDIVTKAPQLAPTFCTFTQKRLAGIFKHEEVITQKIPKAIHYYTQAEGIEAYDVEWALNLDKECNNVLKASQSAIDLVLKEALAGRFPINFTMEMRFIKDSDAYLAPPMAAKPENGGTGYTFYIEILSMVGTPHWNEFSQKIANIWSQLPGARPHWAKSNGLSNAEEFMRKCFKKQIPKFVDALEKSEVDPDGMFLNTYLEHILYPNGHPVRAKLRQKNKENKDNKKMSKSCHIV